MASIEEYSRMLETLQEVNTLCAKAQDHYHRAMGFEAGADHADRKAKFGAMWDGNGLFEKHDQHSRSKKMNHARDESNRGTEELRRAFSLIPRDNNRPCLLRKYYPEEMSRIGIVPIPEMEGGHFGGALMADFAGGRHGLGSEMNDQHAQREIDRNIECIRQCESICAEQQQLLKRMTERVRADRDGRGERRGERQGYVKAEAEADVAPHIHERKRDYAAAEGRYYTPEQAIPVNEAPAEVYVDGGMGMGMGMRGGMGIGAGLVEGIVIEETIDDRRRREDREFGRPGEIQRDELRRDELRRDELRRDEFGGRNEIRRDEFGGRNEIRRDEFGGRDEFRRDEFGGCNEIRRDEFGGRDEFRRDEFGGRDEFRRDERRRY